jgi:lysyl-tRNA synthetase class 1
MQMLSPDSINHALESKAWPFKEAEAILKKIDYKTPEKGYVLFETGYGPSGLPHIGTFGEVLRTSMIMHAFNMISDIPTKLRCVSDDFDGMRKIPDTIPNKDDYVQYMNLPLTGIPDPFGTHESFGHNMNARLRAFLDRFKFEYEFVSASECYRDGRFDKGLLAVLEHYEKIMDIMLPTLGEERQKTYSPFLPVCPETGHILQVPILEVDKENKTITFETESGKRVTIPVTGGTCKLQWKPDFGMRWFVFDVDFEMYGKDHLVNGPIYTRICKALGGAGPHQMFYELFLDEQGQKISKSKGNGLTIDEWLRYAPEESLALFMYQSPTKAKRLYFDVIPKAVDEYLSFLTKFQQEEEEKKRFANPVFHIHNGKPPLPESTITFSLLLNLVSACNSEDEQIIWGYIRQFDPNVNPDNAPFLKKLVSCAINYYDDFVKPNKQYRAPEAKEKEALARLRDELANCQSNSAEDLQTVTFSIGKEFEFELREWFKALYEILLGSSQGPRFGSFVALYGKEKTIELINEKL